METCAAVFLCEGATDVAVLGSCLEIGYGATSETLETGLVRTYESKFVIEGARFGLFAPGGLEKAQKAFTRMATDKAIRGRYPNLNHLSLVRDMNGHDLATLATAFRDLVTDIGGPDTQPMEIRDGLFQISNLTLNQIVMGDSNFGEDNRNAVDDHVVDCLSRAGRQELGPLLAAFEEISGNQPTSKQIVILAMALDGHLGDATGYYENAIKSVSEEWIKDLIERVGLGRVIQSTLDIM